MRMRMEACKAGSVRGVSKWQRARSRKEAAIKTKLPRQIGGMGEGTVQAIALLEIAFRVNQQQFSEGIEYGSCGRRRVVFLF
eukprot:c11599_g1_i1 orf=117-362(+)